MIGYILGIVVFIGLFFVLKNFFKHEDKPKYQQIIPLGIVPKSEPKDLVRSQKQEIDIAQILSTLNKQINYVPEQCNYEVNAVCPNCNKSLPKKPGRKTKCKNCQEFIFVRTHFETKEKILLSEKQLNEYEPQAKKYYDNNDIKRRLIASFETVLYEGKNLRTHLNKELEKKKKEWMWGQYRNIIHSLSTLDELEKKYADSFSKTLECIYLDINNPCNVGKYVIDNNMQEEFPPFKPFDNTPISPYWIERIKNQKEELNLTSIKDVFIEHNTKVFNDLKIVPHEPEIIWEKIKDQFEWELIEGQR